jgi:hypothetical protein
MKRIASMFFLLLMSTVFSSAQSKSVFKIDHGCVDANSVMISYEIFGKGNPLVIVHGGLGAPNDYFLPYLIPLEWTNKIIFQEFLHNSK